MSASSFGPDTPIEERIKGIDESSVYATMVSADYIDDENFRTDLGYAEATGKTIVLFLLNTTAEELPDDLKDMDSLVAILELESEDLKSYSRQEVERVMSALLSLRSEKVEEGTLSEDYTVVKTMSETLRDLPGTYQ